LRRRAARLAFRPALRNHSAAAGAKPGHLSNDNEEQTMFSHIMIGSNDVARSKTFYDAVLGALGANPGFVDDKGRLIYMHNNSLFLVTPPINGQPATAANGGTIGFACDSSAQADAWHTAGCSNGGVTCEDPPGVRESAFGPLYLAYMRDPDGNKLCALHRMG
jgi:catechol 2,3-dioxygenase-like lactoylglutathione lyase family enzyme